MNLVMKHRIEKILAGIPNDNEKKILYVERIKKYSNECGCSWGANFLMASIGGIIVYLVFYYDWQNANPVKLSLIALLAIFLCAGAGKMIGIALAKIKLRLLYKSLMNEYKPKN